MDFRISLSANDFAKLVAGEMVTQRVDCQKIDITLQDIGWWAMLTMVIEARAKKTAQEADARVNDRAKYFFGDDPTAV